MQNQTSRGQGVVAHTFNPSTQETEAGCKFKATIGYTKSIQKQIQEVAHTFNLIVWESHIFNASTRKMETGELWLGREWAIKGKRQELSGVCRLHSLRTVPSVSASADVKDLSCN